MLDLVTIPCLADNYAYLIHDADTGQTVYKAKGIPRESMAAAFDPGSPAVAWDSPNGGLRVVRGEGMTTRRVRRLSHIDNSTAWRRHGTLVVPVHLGD